MYEVNLWFCTKGTNAPIPGHDAFEVTVLARGKLSVRVDPFLSPVSNVVDDEEWMSDGG
ncbi:hypothetical protein [Kribbella sp. ALI-6-A]|uniref:hypothetical protein n=1 Tax=Kribbella sp. ALI-6-A TaxID=1933817 RepID=UPI00143DDFF3|nr:hypothetical protein [Kribbella sp. ALI-6-A]